MGGLVKGLFGGSSSKSTQSSLSENQAYPTLLGLLQPNIGQGNSAMSTLGSLLGIGDPAAGKSTLTNFLDSTGFNFLRDQGERGITGSAAAKGLLNSGATAKAITKYGSDLASTKLNELMGNLTSLGQYGLGSANTIAAAGQKSTSTGTSSGSSSNGIFNSLFPGGLSDARLKHKVTLLGHNSQNIGVYEFEFRAIPGVKHIGVIAQEVKRVLPAAVVRHGPYLAVDYSQIVPLEGTAFTAPVKELA